jgi:hypothetical protein
MSGWTRCRDPSSAWRTVAVRAPEGPLLLDVDEERGHRVQLEADRVHLVAVEEDDLVAGGVVLRAVQPDAQLLVEVSSQERQRLSQH